MFLNCIAVGAGGFLGAVSRYLMGMIPFLQKGSLPYHTLLINVLGAVLIGIVVKTADSTEILNPSTVLFLKVGICGGFTTFPTFSLESLDLLQSGRPAAFAVYAIASVVLCVAGVLGGKWIAGILQA
ncbi:MAG: fluoride efflux transporter CrcB [Clostridia bacterium]